jgi:hypothetical protein
VAIGHRKAGGCHRPKVGADGARGEPQLERHPDEGVGQLLERFDAFYPVGELADGRRVDAPAVEHP